MRPIKKRTLFLIAALLALVVVAGVVRFRGSAKPDPQVRDAVYLLELGYVDQARHILDGILDREPQDSGALLYRGELARGAGEHAAALEYWSRIGNEPAETSATARFLEASVLLELSRAREAEERLRRAINLHPTYRQPREQLLALAVLQRRRAATLEQLEGLSQLQPLSLDQLVLQTVAGQQIIPVDQAIPRLEAFAGTDSQDIHSALALAHYYADSERTADAIELLSQLRARHPKDDRVRGLLAQLLILTDTAAVSEMIGDDVPGDEAPPELWRAAGLAAQANDKAAQAAKCFQHVVRLEGDDFTTRYHLGLLLRRLKEEEQAERYLRESVVIDRLQRQAEIVSRLDRNRPELIVPVLLEVAELHVELHRHEHAIAWFAKALEVSPEEPAALAGIQQARLALNGAPANSSEAFPTMPTNASDSHLTAPTAIHAPRVDESGEVIQRAADLRLRDVSKEVGLDFQYFNGNTGFKYLIESMGGGIAVLDYDTDGWPDLYFPQGCELPFRAEDDTHLDRLFRNLGTGTFGDVTAKAGLRENGYGQGCAVGDWDNDGFADLIIANYGRNTAYRNNGDGTFTDVTREMGLLKEKMSSSAALADLDLDGDLDLYVVNYVDSLKVCRNARGQISTCDPANFNAEQDTLYLNLGDGTFGDVTETSGIVAADGKGLGIVVSDFDVDGWPDLYVANDGTPNFLFRNDAANLRQQSDFGALDERESGGVLFTEQGLVSGAGVSGEGRAEAGMGIACADLNQDLLPDLFVTNFHLETNTLYVNQGGSLFVDMTATTGLAAPSKPMLGFGTQAADLDLDGLQELFVVNGHIDNREEEGAPWKMTAQLFAAHSGGFSDVSARSGSYFSEKHLGRGAARLDWNRDGRPDLIAVHQDAPAALLTNETDALGPASIIELHGVASNRDALGAKILITAGGRTQLRELCGGDGFYSSNERRQLVGLGAGANQIDVLQITWPSGRTDKWHDLPADRLLVVVEGEAPQVRALGGD